MLIRYHFCIIFCIINISLFTNVRNSSTSFLVHTLAHTCTFIYTHLILNSTNHEKKTCFVFIEYIFKSKHLLLLVPIWPPHECMITIYLKIYLSFSIVLPGGSGHKHALLGLIQFLMASIQAMFRLVATIFILRSERQRYSMCKSSYLHLHILNHLYGILSPGT